MICILGYTANATAIPLHMGEIVGEAATEAAGTGAEGTGTGAEGEAHVARALRLLLRATTTGEGEAHYGDSTPVHAAAAFYLIIKLTRGAYVWMRNKRDQLRLTTVLVLFLYAWALPDFRTAQFLSGIATMIPMFAYLVGLHLTWDSPPLCISLCRCRSCSRGADTSPLSGSPRAAHKSHSPSPASVSTSRAST